MKRLLALALLAFGHFCAAQVKVNLSPVARQTFVDNSGSPCAGCKLYSYVAGTTTPLATYTDSGGVSQNTNPITLDVAGGANIWIASASTYKFVLKDSLGTTQWTVDNISGGAGGSSVPCNSAYAVPYVNSAATALTCDPVITINPNEHSLNIGGTITGPYFSLHNMGTIPASWTFDVTTPATALASLGTIPFSSLPNLSPDSVLMNATNTVGSPSGKSLPSGCTNGVNYSTATHTWTCITAATVPLSNLAAQSADTVVMNATGGSASPTAVPLPSGCTNGINYNASTHSWSCIASTPLTCSPSTPSSPPWSCYSISADGQIDQFGVVLAGTTSNTIQTVSITFPTAFSTFQELTVSGGGQADGTDNAYSVFHRGLSSTGATAVIRCSVNIGGSGCTSISQQVPVNWHAKGK